MAHMKKTTSWFAHQPNRCIFLLCTYATLRVILSLYRHDMLLLSYQDYVRELQYALAQGGEFVDTESVPISFKEAIRRAAKC
jgi:hypothetical protein